MQTLYKQNLNLKNFLHGIVCWLLPDKDLDSEPGVADALNKEECVVCVGAARRTDNIEGQARHSGPQLRHESQHSAEATQQMLEYYSRPKKSV